MKKSVLVLLFAILLIGLVSAGTLKVTQEHPFLIEGKWIPASDLKAGDELTTLDGSKVKIISIKDISLQNPVSVYNLEANAFSDFVVDGGVVVHNSDVIPCRPREDFNQLVDFEDVEEIFGANPENLDVAVEMHGVGDWQDVRLLRIKTERGYEEWAYKFLHESGMQNEISSRVVITELGRLIPDYTLETNYALAYPIPEEGVRFEVPHNKKYVLLNEKLDGPKISTSVLRRPESEKMIKNLYGKYSCELADLMRADLRVLQLAFGLQDMNADGLLMGKSKIQIIDLADAAESQEYYLFDEKEWSQFLSGMNWGIEHGWSTIPDYNTLEFKNLLIERAKLIQDNKAKILVIYHDALVDAATPSDEIIKKIGVISENINNLIPNIEAEWNYLSDPDVELTPYLEFPR